MDALGVASGARNVFSVREVLDVLSSDSTAWQMMDVTSSCIAAVRPSFVLNRYQPELQLPLSMLQALTSAAACHFVFCGLEPELQFSTPCSLGTTEEKGEDAWTGSLGERQATPSPHTGHPHSQKPRCSSMSVEQSRRW